MKLILFKTGSSFSTYFDKLLSNNKPQCSMTIHNALSQKEDTAMFGGVVDGEENFLLVFSYLHPFHLCIHTAKGIELQEPVKVLSDFFADEGIIVPGVNARKDVLDIFLSNYEQKTKNKYHHHVGMDLMVLETLTKKPNKKGIFRLGVMDDLPVLAKWYQRFLKEALHENVSLEEQALEVQNKIRRNSLYVLEQEEGLLCTANVSFRYGDLACINGVYTPNVHRGKGYAQSLMTSLCSDLLQTGVNQICLYVDKSNPVSNRVYEKIGFFILENNYDYRLTKS